jgi:hypothetical protein
MKPNSHRLNAKAVQRAGFLARSGDYSCWQEIEAALIDEGHMTAKTALQSQYLRNLLSEHCVEAQSAKLLQRRNLCTGKA